MVETPRASFPEVSIVIRTYNESRYLPDVLRAVKDQQDVMHREVEVIVVDSGSTDGTRDIATQYGARVITIEKSEFTFGRSLNRGCEAAKGDILIFISGHCIPSAASWLVSMLAPFENPAVGIAYGRQLPGEGSKFSEARVFEKYYPPLNASQAPFFCNNANCAVRRSIWKRFRFDESLSGLEDMDFGIKVVGAGFLIQYAPDASVNHIHHENWGQIRRRYEREAIALRSIRPELHLGALEAFYCFVIATCSDMIAAISKNQLFQHFTSILLYRYNQFLGSYYGSRPHRVLAEKERLRYFFPK
jgi:glycosyltransferase involved in cell wall biosynthesis